VSTYLTTSHSRADFVDDAKMPERGDHAISGLMHACHVENPGAGPSAKRSGRYKRTIRDLQEIYAHLTDPEKTEFEASDEGRLSNHEEDLTVEPSDADSVEVMHTRRVSPTYHLHFPFSPTIHIFPSPSSILKFSARARLRIILSSQIHKVDFRCP
jgi:hypothetical protein